MFHRSESILIKDNKDGSLHPNKNKTKNKISSRSQRTILNNTSTGSGSGSIISISSITNRQRASTWSELNLNGALSNTNSNNNSNDRDRERERLGSGDSRSRSRSRSRSISVSHSIDGGLSKSLRRKPKPFMHHRRNLSQSSQNSKYSLSSIASQPSVSDAGNGNGNGNGNGSVTGGGGGGSGSGSVPTSPKRMLSGSSSQSSPSLKVNNDQQQQQQQQHQQHPLFRGMTNENVNTNNNNNSNNAPSSSISPPRTPTSPATPKVGGIDEDDLKRWLAQNNGVQGQAFPLPLPADPNTPRSSMLHQQQQLAHKKVQLSGGSSSTTNSIQILEPPNIKDSLAHSMNSTLYGSCLGGDSVSSNMNMNTNNNHEMNWSDMATPRASGSMGPRRQYSLQMRRDMQNNMDMVSNKDRDKERSRNDEDSYGFGERGGVSVTAGGVVNNMEDVFPVSLARSGTGTVVSQLSQLSHSQQHPHLHLQSDHYSHEERLMAATAAATAIGADNGIGTISLGSDDDFDEDGEHDNGNGNANDDHGQCMPEYPPNLNIVTGPMSGSASGTWADDGTDATALSDAGSHVHVQGQGQGQQSLLSAEESYDRKMSQFDKLKLRNAPASLILQDEDNNLNNNQQQQSQNRHNNLVVLDNVREAMGVGEREGDVEEQNFMMAGAGAGTSTGGGSLSSVFKMLEQSDNSMGSLDLDVFFIEVERVKSFTGSIEMSIDDDTDGTLPLRRDSLATERMSFREERAPSKMNNYLAKAMELFWQKCCCKNAPPQLSWSRVSSALVRHVPCFWIGCGRLETSATDRMILTRLNMLSAVFALWQLGVGIFIMIVFLSDNVAERVGAVSAQSKYREALSPNLWMVSGSLLLLSLVGLVLFITMVVTIPVIRRVNLVGAIRFMWVLYWLIPLQIFLVIALWDYHSVTEVWIKHWWATKSMAWFRKLYCAEGTSNRECAIAFNAPVEWCFENFGAIDCQAIREEAQSKMTRAAYLFIYTNVILGGVLVLILLLSLGLLEGIISAPIVQRSKEANIPLWLTFPAIGCFALGFILRYSPSSLLSNDQGSRIYWIGLSYIVSGTSFTVSALLGWFISAKTVLNIRDKKQKEIAVYLFIIVVILTIAAVASIFCASAIFSLVEEAITDDQRGVIACYVDAASSCSNCVCKLAIGSRGECDPFEFGPPCPEWTKSDVTRIVATQLKQSTSLSAIFAIYALAALRFGFMLRNSISKYEIDYV